MASQYVKFLRGTPTAYAALETKDKDTLYFISAVDSPIGKLYLGDIQVSGYITSDGVNVIDTLGELTDVDLSGLQDRQIIVYDANSSKWIPMDLPQAVSNSVMVGATAETAGSAGLVPAPEAGDEEKFLRGDGTWANINLNGYATKSDVNQVMTKLSTTMTRVSKNETSIEELRTDLEASTESLVWGQLQEIE